MCGWVGGRPSWSQLTLLLLCVSCCHSDLYCLHGFPLQDPYLLHHNQCRTVISSLQPSWHTCPYSGQNKQIYLCILSFPKSTVTGESIFSASVCWNDLPSVTAQTLFFTFSTTLSQASHSHTTCSALSSITNTSFSSTCNNVRNKCILSVSLSH